MSMAERWVKGTNLDGHVVWVNVAIAGWIYVNVDGNTSVAGWGFKEPPEHFLPKPPTPRRAR